MLLRVCTPLLCQHEGIDEETGTNAVGSKKGEHNYRLDRDGAIINKCAFYCLLSTPKKVGRVLRGSNNKTHAKKGEIFVHWETQYRKVAEEQSCIRRPDTGRQCRRASVFCIGSPNTNESEWKRV